jgi:hypothetical protein
MLRNVEAKTAQRFRAATAMLVEIAPGLIEPCTKLLTTLGYRVVAVGHIPAACERLAVVMPLLVVGDADSLQQTRDELRERAVAVGAQIVWLPKDADLSFVTSALRIAAVSALEKHEPEPAP